MCIGITVCFCRSGDNDVGNISNWDDEGAMGGEKGSHTAGMRGASR